MRNKNFFWFITITLAVISIYQLTFTFKASSIENKAEKQALAQAIELQTKAKETGDSALLPNGTYAQFLNSDGLDIAKTAFLNQILREKSQKKVYLGNTFETVKSRSLAFGLDLVGGMSVALEISVPELLLNYAVNQRAATFKKPYDQALSEYKNKGGDFVQLFIKYHEANAPGRGVVRDLKISEMDGLLTIKSTNADVAGFIKNKVVSSMDGVEQIMEKRINQFGVAQPNIQKDLASNRLYIELPGVKDQATVTKKLQSTANLEFFEIWEARELTPFLTEADKLSGFVQIAPAAKAVVAVKDSTKMDSLTAVSKKDTVKADVASEATGKKKLYELLQPSPMPSSIGHGDELVQKQVNLILAREDIQALFPEDLEFMWSDKADFQLKKDGPMLYSLYAVRVPLDKVAPVGGKDIASSGTTSDPKSGGIAVSLNMSSEGAEKWGAMTTKNVGRAVAITMDNVVFSAPTVQNAITSGSTIITGSYSFDEAAQFAGLLNGGALPAPCVVKDQTTVGPTIGAENREDGFLSFGIALLVVFAYMIFYYGKAGIVADVTLIFNVLFIFGALASFGAVLTLSGIAGIVLTIGMAVDANVLIFERIREELTAGKANREALTLGFEKALSSIIDANVTTLITAVVLKIFGTGPIASFATTLIIGIVTSVFAAVIISRMILFYYSDKGHSFAFETKFTKNFMRNTKIDFVGKRKVFYAISGVLILAGAISLGVRGLSSSVEFTGGRTYVYKFEQKVNTDKLRADLTKILVTNGKTSSVEVKTRNSDYEVIVSTNHLITTDEGGSITTGLIEKMFKEKNEFGVFTQLESRSVSAAVSGELKKSSSIAVLFSLIAIFIYILARFGKWQYSTGAILAMAHDVFLIIAMFSLFHGILPINLDLDQSFIAAILTVIGYSINDTIIVYDRIREYLLGSDANQKNELINNALNSTLTRTINTAFTTLIVLIMIFIFGGTAISGFIFALIVGIVVGTYSSLFIATPILIDFSGKKPLTR